jgi:hypothetical protein
MPSDLPSYHLSHFAETVKLIGAWHFSANRVALYDAWGKQLIGLP